MSILTFLFFSVFTVLASSDCTHGPGQFSCVKYLRNYDGDTMTFDLPGVHKIFGSKTKVRLQGVDTAEIKPKGKELPCEKEWARAAQRWVQEQLKSAKRIDLTKINGKDRYGRLLAQVVYDGKDLKQGLLDNHLAVPYVGKKKARVNWCELKLKRQKK